LRSLALSLTTCF